MSSIAEFYSRNLATETRKGMVQKVKNGGTPGMVPFGYLNVRTRTPQRWSPSGPGTPRSGSSYRPTLTGLPS